MTASQHRAPPLAFPEPDAPTRMGWLEGLGLDLGPTRWNLTPTRLIEAALERGEGWLSREGAFVAHTGSHTGRAARDKFVVREAVSDGFWWDSPYQQPLSPLHFERLFASVQEHFLGREAFVLEASAGADPLHRLPVRLICERAWHALFARHLLIPLEQESSLHAALAQPLWTVISAPSLKASPERHGARSSTMIAVCFSKRQILIVGTEYAGEIKKSVFTVLNALLPRSGTLPMHCSANVGQAGDVALFFGMSGTGKTTLSADGARGLIGDDEHGWSDDGIFNFEGGCYAKVIRLSAQAEPEIHRAAHTYGAVLENVPLDLESRAVDLDSELLTENTRAAYPLSFLDNAVSPSRAGAPRHIFFLAADAFGVLPPLARLSPEQAMYHFLSGYTAKIAGTERGLTEPQASFETCFGAPFLPLEPQVYATLLGQRLAAHGTQVWLVNTGWSGGPYGVGQRMPIAHTRALVRAALSGALEGVAYRTEPHFGLSVPVAVPGVPAGVLDPRQTWPDPEAYDAAARALARRFEQNFQGYAAGVSDAVRRAGPRA